VQTDFGTLSLPQPPPWSEGTLAIRPERICLSSDERAANRLRLRVKDVIYRGDHLDVFLEPGALRFSCEPSARLSAGDEVHVELPPRHLEVLRD
jgi:spermidine/putrescine transport system ATP-binding protein